MIICIMLFAAVAAFISTLVKEFKKLFKGRKKAVTVNEIVSISGSQSPLIQELTAPPWVIDEIQAIEAAADVLRQESKYLELQLNGLYDPLEKIQIQKKITGNGEKLAGKYKKINQIKNKYGML